MSTTTEQLVLTGPSVKRFKSEQAVIRVFPSRTQWTPTDEMAFVGEPPLFRPDDRTVPVHVSATFTWHKKEAERIAGAWAAHYNDVKIGGPAYGDAGGEFTPGLYLKTGCTITSRGEGGNDP